MKGHWTKARARLFKIIEELVLWENTTNEQVLEKAREEIRRSWRETCELNKDHPQAAELFDPEKMPGLHDPFAGGGWSPKVIAVWDWKTRIPQTYPELVYYGKIKGGDAVLMEMNYFRQTHYPASFQPVSQLDQLAQQVYELIRLEPMFTGPLRKRSIEQLGCTKSQFDTALKKLQISLNIVRSNDPSLKNDFWLTMREVHLDIVHQHESDSANG